MSSIIAEKKKIILYICTVTLEDDNWKMKNNNIYKFSQLHVFEKFALRGYCCFMFMEIPVLRFRRPILPRA